MTDVMVLSVQCKLPVGTFNSLLSAVSVLPPIYPLCIAAVSWIAEQGRSVLNSCGFVVGGK